MDGTRATMKQEKTFSEIVNEDFRGFADVADAEMLRRPENLDRWYDELVTIMRSFDNQLSAQKKKSAEQRLFAIEEGTMRAYELSEVRVKEWRQHLFNYRRYIEVRIREIRRLRRAMHTNRHRQAIIEHQHMFQDDPERANALLWATVDETSSRGEMAHAGDLKSLSVRTEGSNPSGSTQRG